MKCPPKSGAADGPSARWSVFRGLLDECDVAIGQAEPRLGTISRERTNADAACTRNDFEASPQSFRVSDLLRKPFCWSCSRRDGDFLKEGLLLPSEARLVVVVHFNNQVACAGRFQQQIPCCGPLSL